MLAVLTVKIEAMVEVMVAERVNRSNGGSGGRKGSKNGILQDVGLDEDDGDSTSCSLTSLYNLKTLVNLVQEVRRGLV